MYTTTHGLSVTPPLVPDNSPEPLLRLWSRRPTHVDYQHLHCQRKHQSGQHQHPVHHWPAVQSRPGSRNSDVAYGHQITPLSGHTGDPDHLLVEPEIFARSRTSAHRPTRRGDRMARSSRCLTSVSDPLESPRSGSGWLGTPGPQSRLYHPRVVDELRSLRVNRTLS